MQCNTTQVLQDMGRQGDEILAHITPAEARLLHAITDGGAINPQTGLLEFWWGDGLADNDAQGGYDLGAANDAQAAENESQYSGNGNDHESGNDNTQGGNEDGSNGDILGGDGLEQSQGSKASTPDLEDKDKLPSRQRRGHAGKVKDNSLTSGFFTKKDIEEPATTFNNDEEDDGEDEIVETLERIAEESLPSMNKAIANRAKQLAGPPQTGAQLNRTLNRRNPYGLLKGPIDFNNVAPRGYDQTLSSPSSPSLGGGAGGPKDFRSLQEQRRDLLLY